MSSTHPLEAVADKPMPRDRYPIAERFWSHAVLTATTRMGASLEIIARRNVEQSHSIAVTAGKPAPKAKKDRRVLWDR